MQDLKDTHDIIILGDFNAHIEELDSRWDNNGHRLLDIAEHQNLIIANLLDTTEETFTWSQGAKTSIIDYCLLSARCAENFESLWIDTEGDISLGSDHRTMVASLGRQSRSMTK